MLGIDLQPPPVLLDRACGITGTFTWTGWAVTIENSQGEQFSEGCGQCHIVGQYGPISGAMMPGYTATDAEFSATDCLVCHAVEYDMNARQVVKDENGKPQLHLLPLDGGEASKLIDMPLGAFDPTWLPDGKGIVAAAGR